MKAIIWTKYGSPDGLQLQEVEKPTPKDNEVLIKIHAVTASTPDTEIRRLNLPFLFALPIRIYIGLTKPSRIKILGSEFAGEVVAIGKEVTEYQIGDSVYGYTGLHMSTYAEYMCLPAKDSGIAGVMSLKPTNLTYQQAAAVPLGGLEAFHLIKNLEKKANQSILVFGGGGSIGTWTVQLAKHAGFEVTALDHTSKIEMMTSIGADYVIDYTKEDFTKSKKTYDVIVDTIGKSPFYGSVNALKPNGVYLNANLGVLGRLRKRLLFNQNGKKILPWTSGYSAKNLTALKELIETENILPVIDRVYSLEQMAEAHRYVESGMKKGNVVVTVVKPNESKEN